MKCDYCGKEIDQHVDMLPYKTKAWVTVDTYNYVFHYHIKCYYTSELIKEIETEK